MGKHARTRAEQFASWRLWIVVVAITAGAALFVVVQLSGLRDGSRAVAQTAALRSELLRVAAAADQSARSGEAAPLEAAIGALQEQRAAVGVSVATTLGAAAARAELGRLDAALAALIAAARGFADGGEVGAGGAAFTVAASEVDALAGALATASSARSGELRARVFAGVLVLALSAASPTAGLWYIRRRFGALRRREAALALRPDELTADLPVMLYQAEPNGELVVVSGSCSLLLGRTRGELTGRLLSDFAQEAPWFAASVPPGEVGASVSDAASFSAGWRHADGTLRQLHTVARAVRDVEGRLVAVRGLVRDLSEQHAAEHALRESEERFRTVLETAQNGIMVVNPEGAIELTNSALGELLGYSAEELQQRSVRDLIHLGASDRIVELLAAPIWSGEPRSRRQERFVRQDGSVLDVDLSVSPFRERGHVVGVLVEVRDITESKRAEETIQRLAYVDELTGLPNRSAFNRKLATTLEDARARDATLAVMLFDLDHFKLINDTLGHHAGDRVLRAVAERLQQQLPGRRTLARLGGDEFILLAEVSQPEAAVAVAAEILAALVAPFDYEGQPLDVAASIGVSVFPADGVDGETLIRRADSAMYQAKALGRNNFQSYSQAMELAAQDRLQLHSGVRRALSEHEFALHYQPLIDGRDGAIVGAEALLRWAHPRRGLVHPDELIPVLEETGLILPVGEWVIGEACAQAKRWQELGLPGARVAVNLSVRQLLQPDLVAMIERSLTEQQLAPECLRLELTEAAALRHLDIASRVLFELRELGVEAALDDFGTARCSPADLQRLPLHGVKVDRSFVSEVAGSQAARTIVTEALALGRTLGLGTAAEGVETESQRQFLRSLGCDVLQGFLFSRPLPAVQFEALLRDQAASERAA